MDGVVEMALIEKTEGGVLEAYVQVSGAHRKRNEG